MRKPSFFTKGLEVNHSACVPSISKTILSKKTSIVFSGEILQKDVFNKVSAHSQIDVGTVYTQMFLN